MSNALPSLEDLTSGGTWNKRYREMQSLVHQGPEARKLIVDAFTIISKSKDLSFGERKMLDLAQNYQKHKDEHDAKVIELEQYRKAMGYES
jgi:hypothetical protein